MALQRKDRHIIILPASDMIYVQINAENIVQNKRLLTLCVSDKICRIVNYIPVGSSHIEGGLNMGLVFKL
jgi:hypothetical protein